MNSAGIASPAVKPQKSISIDPATISRFAKRRFLQKMNEDEFRDRVVRPLFHRRGLKDGRDLCGPCEQGKDCVFLAPDALGAQMLYAVQTKRGNINMSRKATENVEEAATQLRTALATTVTLLATRQQVYPSVAILCASGSINQAARDHIHTKISDPRIRFLDADELIPELDERYPELWYGIDPQLFPYLKRLKEMILQASDTISLAELGVSTEAGAPVTDESYVTLFLHRYTSETRKSPGEVIKRSPKRGTIRGAPVVESVPKVEQIPAHAVLNRRDPLILIIGEAGFGKTTAIRRMAYSVAEKALQSSTVEQIPILLKAKDIAGVQRRLVDLAAETTATLSGYENPAFSTDELRLGRIVIMVDGLDEILGDAAKENVIARILEFNREFPRNKVILTSRPSAFITNNSEVKGFVRFRLTPVNINQTEKMVARLVKGRSLPEEQTQEMLRKLQDVHGIELTPLLVTVFVATSDYSRRDIPANITEVFRKFTEMMLGRWDERKGLAHQYQYVLKDFLLRQLAFHMHRQGITEISETECQELMATELKDRGKEADIEALFDEILQRSGILRIDGGTVEFRHFMFQEFFAGRGIPSSEFLKTALPDEWWRNGAVFYFGEHPDGHADLAALIPSIDEQDGPGLYHAAIAIGLALQACYLSKTDEKEKTLEWVVGALARAQASYVKSLEDSGAVFPLHNFLYYYLQARDAVASEIIRGIANAAMEAIASPSGTPLGELPLFWIIVGLIESDQLNEAANLIKHFHPADTRLLLAIHLGCFLLAHLRVSAKKDKDAAMDICKRISPRIDFLRREVLKEWKGILLEMRQGKIHVLDAVVDPATKPVSEEEEVEETESF